MDIEFDCDFRFAGADVAVGAGRVQETGDQKLLPEVGTLVQEDLHKRQTKTGMTDGTKDSALDPDTHVTQFRVKAC